MAEHKATLHVSQDGESIDLPIHDPSLGTTVINVQTLGQHNLYTYDPGFLSTASCESKITYIDGSAGILLYRGYPIEQLAEHANYEEIAYLLLLGDLPTSNALKAFKLQLHTEACIDKDSKTLLQAFDKVAHPMAMVLSLIGHLSGKSHEKFDITNADDRIHAAIHLIAKIPTLTAMCYRYSLGLDFVEPNADLDYAENFLYMMHAEHSPELANNALLANALDRIFILHADHEQNASTSTVRLAGSTGTHPFAAIAAGAAALWGPAHGGANEACLNMLKEIGDVSNIPEYIKRAKDHDDPFRLMGFGHRVYKNFDPRATLMRETCHEVLGETGVGDSPLFKIAVELERIALEDDYFIERKLYPNVDFYSGITQSAIGIPSPLFTAIFTLARTSGWVAQWHEMLSSETHRIGRPRQLYTGPTSRDYVAIDKR